MLTQLDFQTIGKIIDERLQDGLKKGLRGVARKKDLRLMEERIIRKINLVSDSHDSRLTDLEKRTDLVETHLHLPPISNL